MQYRWIGNFIWLLFLVPLVHAQNGLPPEVAKSGFADLIVYNGKIVSMDDWGLNSNVGTVYEALAIKNNRILALGTAQRIRAMADSNTRQIDVQGLTVIPGIIESHAHLYGNEQIANQLGMRIPNRHSVRVQAGKDFESTRLKIENQIQEAVKKANPLDWIHVTVTDNEPESVSTRLVRSWLTVDVIEPKDRLDRIAPNNPVLVQNGPRANLNTKGFEEAEKLVPFFTEFAPYSVGGDFMDEAERGYVGVSVMQSIQWDVWYRNQPISLIGEMIRRDLEMAVAHGVTTFSSRVPHPIVMDGFVLLRRENALPVRFAALYEVHRRPANPEATRQFYRMTGNLTGLGDNNMWVHGVASELWDSRFPQACLGKDFEAPPDIKDNELCPKPGDLWWDVLQNAMESGWRLAGIHAVGSDGARRFIQLIEMAMKNTGMTVEDVRKLRPTVEHGEVFGVVPDMVEGLKKYNIIVSLGTRDLLYFPDYVQNYGPAIESFIVPVKSLMDKGVKVVGQNHTYREIGYLWTKWMTRELDNGKKVGAKEAVDRVTVLKAFTSWPSEYVMKEQDLGTLEVGKLADFVVLDRDYFTIPQAEIVKIRPQMTVMDGRIRHLGTELAAKVGMEPVGYQFPPDYEPWGQAPAPTGGN